LLQSSGGPNLSTVQSIKRQVETRMSRDAALTARANLPTEIAQLKTLPSASF